MHILAGEGFGFTLGDGVVYVFDEFVRDLFVFHAPFRLQVAYNHGLGLVEGQIFVVHKIMFIP